MRRMGSRPLARRHWLSVIEISVGLSYTRRRPRLEMNTIMPSLETKSISEFLDGVIGDEVRDLGSRQGHLEHLRAAILLALEHFKSAKEVRTRIQPDPDEDLQRVIIDLTVDCEIDEALASKDAFDRAWVQTVPAGEQDSIRLLYDFV